MTQEAEKMELELLGAKLDALRSRLETIRAGLAARVLAVEES